MTSFCNVYLAEWAKDTAAKDYNRFVKNGMHSMSHLLLELENLN